MLIEMLSPTSALRAEYAVHAFSIPLIMPWELHCTLENSYLKMAFFKKVSRPMYSVSFKA